MNPRTLPNAARDFAAREQVRHVKSTNDWRKQRPKRKGK